MSSKNEFHSTITSLVIVHGRASIDRNALKVLNLLTLWLQIFVEFLTESCFQSFAVSFTELLVFDAQNMTGL